MMLYTSRCDLHETCQACVDQELSYDPKKLHPTPHLLKLDMRANQNVCCSTLSKHALVTSEHSALFQQAFRFQKAIILDPFT